MISRMQFYLLTINFTLGTSLFVLIQRMITQAEQDAWLIPLWAGIVGVLVSLLWIWLFRYYPEKSLVQIIIDTWGKYVGTFVSILYFLSFCFLAGWVLRNLSDFMNGTIMPETPKSVFHLMFLLVACYAVSQGVETIGRLNQIVTPFLFFPFWLVLLLAMGDWDTDRLFPLFQANLKDIFGYHAILGFPYLETVALTMLFPLVRGGAGRPFVWGILTASATFSLVLIMMVGLLGVERAAQLTFPVYTAVQEVTIGQVYVNIHSIVSVILLVLIFIKLVVAVYGASAALRQLFRPQAGWPHFLSLIIFLSAVALSIYENTVQNGEWNQKYSLVYNSIFAVLVPLLLLLTTLVRKAFSQRGPVAKRRR